MHELLSAIVENNSQTSNYSYIVGKVETGAAFLFAQNQVFMFLVGLEWFSVNSLRNKSEKRMKRIAITALSLGLIFSLGACSERTTREDVSEETTRDASETREEITEERMELQRKLERNIEDMEKSIAEFRREIQDKEDPVLEEKVGRLERKKEDVSDKLEEISNTTNEEFREMKEEIADFAEKTKEETEELIDDIERNLEL